MDSQVLDGIRVLELGHAISAPHCCQILADQGADVIRVEPPGGDRTRGALPVHDGDSFYFASHNRAKRSIILDLKRPEGRELFLRLVESSDAVVTNYSAGVPDRLGIGYGDLRQRNERIIFAHITGFGYTGPYRDFGAYDGIIQAMSGIPTLTGEPGSGPVLVGAFVADHLAATQAALGVLFALIQRRTTGKGTMVDLSMLEGYMSTLAHHLGEALDVDRTASSNGNAVPTAFANTFRAADGYVYLAPLGPHAWTAMLTVMEAPDWLRDADRGWLLKEGRERAERQIEEWTSRRSRSEVIDLLRAVDVPCGPVNDVREAAAQPVVAARRAVVKVEMPSGRKMSVPGPEVRLGRQDDEASDAVTERLTVPGPGEDTREVLMSLGLEQSEIDRLLAEGVVESSEAARG